ncbi:uncharacterized protein Dwil_GK19190 [Drosophila willistoni]|uniref:Uroporphyrinogen-III synthase n=1 Tax=Drosophila willistoni TaxID=7260 RepID=B4NA74_DROWI|nr:uroporphyrinogen-III synthase [Drosophila willistoni]EDW80717.1 uncharacterized protein Dwil_GK19190 [Drosophila willistoni]
MGDCVKHSVVLLKSQTQDDSYDERPNLEAIYINPVTYVFKNIPRLRAKLLNPHKYAGIILCAPRCVYAVNEALQKDPLPTCWRPLHNYALGKNTRNMAYYSLQNLPTMGVSACSAHNLCDLIRETFGPKRDLPFLLPCGNLASNTLHLRLVAQGFRVDSCECFESQCHPHFMNSMKQALKLKKLETIVFFSPASVKSGAEFIKKYSVSIEDRKLIAVGRQTQKAMLESGLKIHRLVESPLEESVVNAIIN